MPHLHECCTYLNHQSLSFAFQKVFVSSFHTSCTSQSSCSMLSGQKPLKFKWVTSLHEKGNITLNINVINCNNNNNNKSKKTSMNSLEVLLNTIYYMKNLQTIVWIFCFFCRRKQRRLHRQTEIVMLNTDVCVCVSVGGPEERWEASQVVTPHERYLIVSNDFCTLPSTTCGFSLLCTLSQTKTRQIQRLFYISTTWSHPCQQQIVGVFFPPNYRKKHWQEMLWNSLRKSMFRYFWSGIKRPIVFRLRCGFLRCWKHATECGKL